jgi:hypothetical protein
MKTYQQTSEPVAAADDPAARDLLHRAFGSTYRWSAAFKGFSARLRVEEVGRTVDGAVDVRLPESITVSLADPELQKWTEGQVGMMAVHRGHRTFEEADGRHTLTLAEEDGHPLGRLLQIHGDGMNSRYRVAGDRIRQINRSMGPVRFTINVEDALTTPDGRHLDPLHRVLLSPDGRLDQAGGQHHGSSRGRGRRPSAGDAPRHQRGERRGPRPGHDRQRPQTAVDGSKRDGTSSPNLGA